MAVLLVIGVDSPFENALRIQNYIILKMEELLRCSKV